MQRRLPVKAAKLSHGTFCKAPGLHGLPFFSGGGGDDCCSDILEIALLKATRLKGRKLLGASGAFLHSPEKQKAQDKLQNSTEGDAFTFQRVVYARGRHSAIRVAKPQQPSSSDTTI